MNVYNRKLYKNPKLYDHLLSVSFLIPDCYNIQSQATKRIMDPLLYQKIKLNNSEKIQLKFGKKVQTLSIIHQRRLSIVYLFYYQNFLNMIMYVKGFLTFVYFFRLLAN